MLVCHRAPHGVTFGERTAVKTFAMVIVAVLSIVFAFDARAQAGGAEPIAIGMSTPLSGPNERYGQGLLQGVRLALDRLNEGGGVGGRKVELLVKDDGGDPVRARDNTSALAQAGVIALTGYHGARAIEAAMAAIESTDLPMVGAASSAESLREPPRRTLFHLRAGALEEMQAIVLHLDTLSMTRFAVIAQDDGLGNAGYGQLVSELARIGIRPLVVARLKSQDGAPALAAAVRSICASEAQAVVLALDASLAISAARQARSAGCHPQLVVMSETGAALQAQGTLLARELAGLIVAQVLPHPGNQTHPLVAEYTRALARLPDASASYPSLEGYLYMRVLSEALRQCGRGVSRECVLRTMEAKPIDVPGLRINFTNRQRRGLSFVELTLLDAQGRFRR